MDNPTMSDNSPLYCINDMGLDPYFNVALEEYLLKSKTDDFFRLWRNDNTIVVGKNQNAMGEINVDYVNQNNINVVRRYSGGGTVYHDLGNLNYTFIANVPAGESKIDFHKYGQPIIDMLAGYDITAHFDARHSIRIGDLKISGNAEAVYRNRVLHHGCILFDSTLDVLNKSILVDESKFQSRATKSARATVTNIKSHTDKFTNTDDFRNGVMSYIKQQNPTACDYTLTDTDIAETKQLAHDKYRTWAWNYGRSPEYTVTTQWQGTDVSITVKRGTITEATSEFAENLIRKQHTKTALTDAGLPADLVNGLF